MLKNWYVNWAPATINYLDRLTDGGRLWLSQDVCYEHTSFCVGRCAACLYPSSRRAVEGVKHPLYTLTEQCPPRELWSLTSSEQRWEDGEPPELQKGKADDKSENQKYAAV